jgi:protein disulfide-isomerase
MTMIFWGSAGLGLIVAGADASEAARPEANRDQARVAWHESVDEAWRTTQRDGRPMVVFVTRDNCYYCEQMKDRTYTSPAVAVRLRDAFVPLVLDGTHSSPLLRELNVRAYPSTFVISPKAVVLDRIDGYVSPEVLAARLEAVRARPPSDKVAGAP